MGIISNFFDLSSLGLTTSQAALVQDFVAQMQTAYPGYSPSTANPEYVVAEILASQFADISNLCVAGSTELFRQYGLQLINLPMQTGTAAAAIATVTAVDTSGYTLPAGTQLTLTLNGTAIAFQTASTLTIGSGSTSGTVTVVGIQTGSAFNGATNPCQLVSQITWVTGVTVAAPASGGADQETDDAYLLRLANTLTTLAPRPITASDYATLALNFQPAPGTDQEQVGRAAASDGLSTTAASFTVSTTSTSPNVTVTTPPGTGITAAPGAGILGTNIPSSTFTASTTNNSPTLSSVSSFTNVQVGALVTGTGIPAGTEILATNAALNQITMSANATATGSGITVTFSTTFVLSSTSSTIVMSQNASGTGSGITATVGDTLGNQRTVALAVTDSNGNALNTDTLAAVKTYLQGLREVNFVVSVISPSYPTIYVTVTVKGATGYTTATVQANVQSAILAYLTPQNFGLPTQSLIGWVNSSTIYQSRLLAAVQQAPGVDHVVAGTLAFGTSASPSNTADLVLPGQFPLPVTTTTSVPTSAITVQ